MTSIMYSGANINCPNIYLFDKKSINILFYEYSSGAETLGFIYIMSTISQQHLYVNVAFMKGRRHESGSGGGGQCIGRWEGRPCSE